MRFLSASLFGNTGTQSLRLAYLPGQGHYVHTEDSRMPLGTERCHFPCERRGNVFARPFGLCSAFGRDSMVWSAIRWPR